MTYTCKVVYMPIHSTGGARGVAFVEAGDRAHAMQVFKEQNQGRTAPMDQKPDQVTFMVHHLWYNRSVSTRHVDRQKGMVSL